LIQAGPPERLRASRRIHAGRAMAVSFQIAHSDFCRKSRTPTFPQTNGLEQILTTEVTTKSPFRGCPMLKSEASLTFHKSSSYAAFEKRPPCPYYRIMKAKLARRPAGGAWDSSKRRVFRIKTTPACTAARVEVCLAKAQWNPHPSFPAGRNEGRLATQEQMRPGEECHAEPFSGLCSPVKGAHRPRKRLLKDRCMTQ
jgi:hypothetical protein